MSTHDTPTNDLPAWAATLLDQPGSAGVSVSLSRFSTSDPLLAEVAAGRWQLAAEVEGAGARLYHGNEAPADLGAGWREELRELRRLLDDPRIAALLDTQ
ncbi:MAG TPA: hypothetical protein PKD53_26210 [Chloroflexaceae bacterium]|nr:hypothetical protein [Chloroflexaceae bacterium]